MNKLITCLNLLGRVCVLPFQNGNLKRFTNFTESSETEASSSVSNENHLVRIDESYSVLNSSLLKIKVPKDATLSFDCQNADVELLSQNEETRNAFVKLLGNQATIKAIASTNNESCYQKAFFVKGEDKKIYQSLISLDMAKKEAGQNPDKLYSAYKFIDNPIIPISQGHKISATFKWKDSIGTSFPLVGAKLVLNLQCGKKYSQFTNDQGTALFDFDYKNAFGGTSYPSDVWNDIQNKSYTLKLELQNELITVRDQNRNRYAADIDNSLVTGETIKNVALCFELNDDEGNESDFGEAAQIFQAYYYYSKHALEFNDKNELGNLSVIYPAKEDEWFNYSEKYNEIHIGNGSLNNQSIKPFESWDAMGHEYGHHIERVNNFTQRLGYNHWVSEDDCVNLYNAKGVDDREKDSKDYYHHEEVAKVYGLKLAWAESWPTFWATRAQSSFPDELKAKTYLSIGDSKYYASNYYNDKNGNPKFDDFDYHLTNGKPGYALDISGGGDSCELAIIRFLYQLWDGNNEDLDVFTIGEKELWTTLKDAIRDQQTDYFYQYLSYLEQDYGEIAIYNLAQEYHLVPANIDLKEEYGTYKMTWTPNAPNSKLRTAKTGYNQYCIWFFRDKNDISPIQIDGNNWITDSKAGDSVVKSYTLDSSVVKKLKSWGTFYIRIDIRFYYSVELNETNIGPISSPLIKKTLE